jgi:hypothetical protein
MQHVAASVNGTGSVPFRRGEWETVARETLETHLRACVLRELPGQPPHDCAGNSARASVELEIGQREICIRDAALASGSHRCERVLGQSLVPQNRSHSPDLAVARGRGVVLEREGDEAEAGMTDANVEIELELLRNRVGPTFRERARPQAGSPTGIETTDRVASIASRKARDMCRVCDDCVAS